jgi:hypothetical protein
MTATSDPFGKRDFGGHWISLIHPTVMITPQKVDLLYIGTDAFNPYINA